MEHFLMVITVTYMEYLTSQLMGYPKIRVMLDIPSQYMHYCLVLFIVVFFVR